MASSNVMASTSPPSPDLPRQSGLSPSSSSINPTTTPALPLLPHQHYHHQLSDHAAASFGSMNMEEILKNMYSEPDSLASDVDGSLAAGYDTKSAGGVAVKSVDEVWKDIVSGAGGGGGNTERMTLEDFLTKAGAVNEEDLRVPPPHAAAGGGFGVDAMMNVAAVAAVEFPAAPGPVVLMQNGPGGSGLESSSGFGSGMPPAGGGEGGTTTGNGRGKRRGGLPEEVTIDKVTQQKQRRMIKNRESAARSRERKQAYIVELESLVIQLEEENARLLRQEAEQNKERFKQLMENLIPVVEQQRPPRVLRRVQSMSW